MPFTLKESGFEIVDYVTLIVLVLASCAGGIWYSTIASRKEAIVDIKDYLLGGKKMSIFPVSLSLIASYVSGVTILGTPGEIYNYGTQYTLIVFSIVITGIIVIYIYLPVFYTLRLSSSYEYLELRFNRHVRAVASILFLLDEMLFLPMVVYVPALACNQLTGYNVFGVAGLMVLICGLYTVLGGLRAVVWTDSVQTGIMFIGTILVAIAGCIHVGGIKKVFSTVHANNRLRFDNWSFSPLERQTGWGAIIGGSIYWTCFNSVNQTMVQRYIALPSKRHAISAIGIFCFGAAFAILLCVLCGLAAFTAWVNTGCDKDGSPLVDDRLLPAFVTYVSRNQKLPGLSGLFLAGVFGAGLSSLSAVLNACALVGVEDLLRGWMRVQMKPLVEGIIARTIAAILAIISILMLMVISKLGGVLGVATALSAIAASTTCGIFTLGMLCSWVGSRGAIAGGLAGALMAGTISMGTQAAAAAGLRANPLPFNEACAKNASFVLDASKIDPETIMPLFRISYHWIAPMGLITTLVVGAIGGWFMDKESRKLDAELFTPCVWRWLPEEAHKNAGMYRIRLAERRARQARPLLLDTINNDINVTKDLPVFIEQYLPTNGTCLVRAEETQQTSPTNTYMRSLNRKSYGTQLNCKVNMRK